MYVHHLLGVHERIREGQSPLSVRVADLNGLAVGSRLYVHTHAHAHAHAHARARTRTRTQTDRHESIFTADVFLAKPMASAQRADDSEFGSTPTTYLCKDDDGVSTRRHRHTYR